MAIFTIMMWSLNIVYSKYIAEILKPLEILFIRLAITFALMVLVPIVSIIAAYFLSHEQIDKRQIFGALLIMSGIVCFLVNAAVKNIEKGR